MEKIIEVKDVTAPVKSLKEWFGEIRKEQYEIEHLRLMIESAETGLLPSGICYDKDKVQTIPQDTMSKVLAKAVDMQNELEECVTMLQERRIEAERRIQTLENSEEREVMRYYYLDNNHGKPLTWEQVGELMNYNRRHVLRLHGRALFNLMQGVNE